MTKAKAQPAHFTGFGPKALDFFKALAFHQSKVWFDENRALYESDVKAPLENLIGDLTEACAKAGLPLRGDGRSVFRLHRDIRFAKDKRPYKTNGGAVLSQDGTKKHQGFLYIHVDPEGCFVAAGFWHPEPAQLALLRQAIVRDLKGFRALTATLDKAGLPLADDDALSRLPKGFEGIEDVVAAAGIKRRNLIVRRDIAAARIREPGLVADILAFAKEAEPLLRFGWRALGTNPPD